MDSVVDDEGLNRASADRACTVGCLHAGLRPAGAELLRLGENAIYALPSQAVVVRVARSDTADVQARVAKELAVAQWLVSHGFPALRPRDDLPQPVHAEGRLITFWEYVPPSPVEPTVTDLASLLRDLHALPAPHFAVPVLDPFPVMRDRLRIAHGVKQRDVDFLTEACARAEAAFATIMDQNPSGVIHGDAHRGNLLAHGDRILLIDYEDVALGPRAWDLVPTATAVDRFGLPPTDYEAFCRSYGQDVTKCDEYSALRTIRELFMVTWLMQNAQSGPAAAEFALRMESLRKDDLERRWRAL
jgi:Ser/Thr protein kinase RdoA (MazF antagonist)